MIKPEKIKLIVIGGPTATGKTSLAIEVAKQINGEIINADSVQVYKYLNIGSNKGNISQIGEVEFEEYKIPVFDIENSGINGYLFDLVTPNQSFTLAHYQKLAKAAIAHIVSKNKVPILIGGTGLYIDSIIKNYQIMEEDPREDQRAFLNLLTLDKLQDLLNQLNPGVLDQLNNSDKNNPRRIIRLIEKAKKKTIKTEMDKYTDLLNDSDNNQATYDFIFLYPEFDREKLMQIIDNRVLEMFEAGFVSEVEELLKMGYDSKYKAMQSTGYSEILEMLIKQDMTFEECIAKVQLAHRQYAKRQITWFEAPGRGYDLKRVRDSKEAINAIASSFSS